MHRALSSRWLSRALRVGEANSSTKLPLYLCPSVLRAQGDVPRRGTTLPQQRELHVEPSALPEQPAVGETTTTAAAIDPTTASPLAKLTPPRTLPTTCSGCGAFSQTDNPKHFGYYNLENKRVRRWLNRDVEKAERPAKKEEQVVSEALQSMTPEQLEELGLDPTMFLRGEVQNQEKSPKNSPAPKSLVCDRCHTVEHNSSTDLEMFHPTVESLRDTIEESPHKYNHIYHVIDAADFPMSLVPRLNVLLGDIRLRTKNRRSRVPFVGDRMIEMTFVITRADLLGPTKESVDRMMPYLQQELRTALGRLGERVRLGNVTCVSARRGWWTKHLKERIWERGGAAWMIGKTNVGKSQLFEAIYPKGRLRGGQAEAIGGQAIQASPREHSADNQVHGIEDTMGELLPPLQPLQEYPDMPLVSAMPGTTASPIRVPFGNKKGELIDLPGLARSDLELYVRPEHRKSLIMQDRIVPEQRSVPAAKSLVLGGGLIRITPASQDLHFLMYNFTPLQDHLTSTPKAIEMQNQLRSDKSPAWTPGMENIGIDGLSSRMSFAGRFELKTDVSKLRAGPLTRKDSVNLTVDRLPFRVLSVDILIEGVGYVEIVCQVRLSYLEHSKKAKMHWEKQRLQDKAVRREAYDEKRAASLQANAKRDPFAAMTKERRGSDGMATPKRTYEEKFEDKDFQIFKDTEPDWPAVDVFSPKGWFIGSRDPIQGWMRNKPLVKPEHRVGRPRGSAKGMKKKEKMQKRVASQQMLDSVFKRKA